MNVLHLKSSELKEITQNLTRHKVIFHPSISPDGIPDFTGRKNRKHIIILDRNLLTPFVSLLRNGHLNDEHMLKLISSLIFWSLINNVSVNGGFALSEYANHKGGDTEANEENELFLKAFNHYPIPLSGKIWHLGGHRPLNRCRQVSSIRIHSPVNLITTECILLKC